MSSRVIAWLGLGYYVDSSIWYHVLRLGMRARFKPTSLARETDSPCFRLEYVVILSSWRQQTRLALAFGHVRDSSGRGIGTLGNSGFLNEPTRRVWLELTTWLRRFSVWPSLKLRPCSIVRVHSTSSVRWVWLEFMPDSSWLDSSTQLDTSLPS